MAKARVMAAHDAVAVTGPAAEVLDTNASGTRRRRPGMWRKRTELTVLLTPAVILFVGFVLVPIGVAAYYSFYNWSGYGPVTDYIGLKNYRDALTGHVFLLSIRDNLVIVGLSLVIQLPLSIGLAMMLNRRVRGRSVLRLLVFAPYVLSEATTAVIWLLMLQPNGFVDQLFKSVGLGSAVHLWLADTGIVLYTLFVVLTWKYIGFGIILLLAGLQGVPHELREVAAIDGATPWQTTRYVVLPLLGPTIRIWTFLTVIGSLQVFDLVWIITKGGPADASSTMATYVFDFGMTRNQVGFGSAVAVILFAICFVFALVYQRFVLRRDTEGALTRMVG